MRKAFTLIELLIVITIMGIVAGLTLPNLTRAVDQARETTCRTNLRNLQAAVVNHAVARERGELPLAGSYESHHTGFARDSSGNVTADIDDFYRENRGWISWTSGLGTEKWNYWNNAGNPNDWTVGDSKNQDHTDKMNRSLATLWKSSGGDRALDQGSLWRHTGPDARVYRCPVAARYLQSKAGAAKKRDTLLVTYVMNEYFGYEDYRTRRYFPNLENFGSYPIDASTLLLFAERRLNVVDGDPKGVWESSVLLTKGTGDTQNGFGNYHGKKRSQPNEYGPGEYGLVVFMDGHVDQFPARSAKNNNSAWFLCRGIDDF